MSYKDGTGNFYIAKLKTQIRGINKEIIIDPGNEYLLGGGWIKPIIDEERIKKSKTVNDLMINILYGFEFFDVGMLLDTDEEREKLYPFSISNFKNYLNANSSKKFKYFKETINDVDSYIHEIINISNNINDIDFIDIIEEHFVDNSSDADLLDYLCENEIKIPRSEINNYNKIIETLKNNLTNNSEIDNIAKCVYNMTEPRHYKATKTIRYIPNDYNFDKTLEINNIVLSQSLIEKKEITKKKEILKIFNNHRFIDALDFSRLPKELLDDKEIGITAVNRSCYYFQFLSDKLKEDKDIIWDMLMNKENRNTIFSWSSYSFRDLSDEIKSDREFIVKLLKNKCDYPIVKYMNKSLRNDKEIILLSIKLDSYNFKYASKELKNDKYFCIEAMKVKKSVYQYFSLEMQEDVDILAIKKKK